MLNELTSQMTDSTYAPRKFPVRTILYGVVILYLFCDLFWLKGPLYRTMRERVAGTDESRRLGERLDWIARVNGAILTRGDLERGVDEYLYVRGKTREDLPDPGPGLLAIQVTVLNRLVEDALLQEYSRLKPEPITDAEVDGELRRFTQQFPDRENFETRLREQGLTEPKLRAMMRDRVLQTKWLETRVAKAAKVTEEEARDWFDGHRGQLGVAEAVRARHIFLTRHDQAKPERDDEIAAIYERVLAGEETFAELAAKFSEDGRSKLAGGDLGYFGSERMPVDFFETVAAMEIGVVGEPFETELGWHIVEVTDRLPVREATYEEMAAEVIAHLESVKRAKAVDLILLDLKERAKLEYFYENLDK